MMQVDPLKQEGHDAEIDRLAENIRNQNKIYLDKMEQLQKPSLAPETKIPDPIPEIPSEDTTSAHGQFGWTELADTCFPYIMRSGGNYLALRMLENAFYAKYPFKEVALCIDVEKFKLTKVEAQLLNEINVQHCDNLFGSDTFTDSDDIIHLEDANKMHKFLEFCHSKLLQQNTVDGKHCGFVRIASEKFLPYIWLDSKKYVPLFYLAGESQYLEKRSVDLNGWGLAYLKFICKYHNTTKSLLDQKSVRVVDLELLKKCFLPETLFEEVWPPIDRLTILLGPQVPDENLAQDETKKKHQNIPKRKIARNDNKRPKDNKRSGNFNLISSKPKFKTMTRKQIEKSVPLGVVSRNLNRNISRSTPNGSITPCQAIANMVIPQTVFSNLQNCYIQTNNTQVVNTSSRLPISVSNGFAECTVITIPEYAISTDYRTAYSLKGCRIGRINMSNCINFCPGENYMLVPLTEVSYKLLKVSYATLKNALDYLGFIVYLPNTAQKELLSAAGVFSGMGLISSITLKEKLSELKKLCGLLQ